MKRYTSPIVLLSAMLLFVSTMSFAQATRTWVSGVGDDINPGKSYGSL